MRLWIFNREFPPTGHPCNSGVVKAVDGLAAGLVQCGVDVTILCENLQDLTTVVPAGYTVRCFANPQHAKAHSSLSDGLRRFIASSDGPVIALLNGIFNPSVYRMSRALRRANIPYIVAPHDPYHPEIFRRRRFLKTLYWHLFESKLLRESAGVQVLDKRHTHWLTRLGIARPVIECQNGFSPDDLSAIPQPVFENHPETRMLFLGRLDIHNKGLDLLIEAFGGVAKEHPQAKLTIKGPDWGDRRRIEHLIALAGLQSTITLEGPTYDIRAPILIAGYDVFCLPSRFEGFGLSALEAMLAGRVLLVTDIAGIAPHVRASDCGVVVDANADSVRQGLLELLQRRDHWREMGLRGRQYAIDKMGWKDVATHVAGEYKALLEAHGRHQVGQRTASSHKTAKDVSIPGRVGL